MFWAVRVLVWKLATMTYRYSLQRALAIPPRGGVKNDSLKLRSVCNRLEIECAARDIHPWDRNDSTEAKARKFVEQSLADTEAVIDRLFRALPQVDVIDLKVRDPNSDKIIAAGTVDRSSLDMEKFQSVRMRLMARGMKHYLDGTCFEPLDPAQHRMEHA